MTHHLTTERLHDLLDGRLSPDESARARTHLAGCAVCREAYEALQGLVSELGGLPREARVPDGLWQGIEARIATRQPTPDTGAHAAGGPDGADVLSLDEARSRRRRLAFTVPQLAAAALVVALVSGGGMWMALSRPGGSGPSPVATARPADGFGTAARMAASGDAAYDQALLQLQALVDQGRSILAPETVNTLDRSLRTIDDAIAQIREALAKDPSSQLLNKMLINQQRTKLRVLKQAAIAMQARS